MERPLPLPKNAQLNDEMQEITFTVKIDGTERQCTIMSAAVAKLYPKEDARRAIERSSLITRKVAELLKTSDDVEPIYLTNTMFDAKGR